MKKILLVGLSISSLLLTTGCGIKKNLSPEKVLKETQANVIDKISNTIIGIEKGEITVNLTAGVDVNGQKADAKLNIKGLYDKDKSSTNINGIINFNAQEITGKVDANVDIVAMVKKMFFKVNNLDINISDPNLQAQTNMLKMLVGKWFYLNLPEKLYQNNRIEKDSTNKVEVKKLLKEYSLFKITDVIGERQYKVKLNHKNIVKIITKLGNLTGDQEEIKQQLSGVDIDAIINIENDNLHFTLSGYLVSEINKEPFKLVYLKNKFQLELPNFKVDLNLKDSNYKGHILVEKDLVQVKIPVEGKLSKNDFSIKVDINVPQQPIKLLIDLNLKVKELKTVEIKVPENATDIEEALKNLEKISE